MDCLLCPGFTKLTFQPAGGFAHSPCGVSLPRAGLLSGIASLFLFPFLPVSGLLVLQGSNKFSLTHVEDLTGTGEYGFVQERKRYQMNCTCSSCRSTASNEQHPHKCMVISENGLPFSQVLARCALIKPTLTYL